MRNYDLVEVGLFLASCGFTILLLSLSWLLLMRVN